MTEFDVRISQRNARSTRIIDKLVQDMKRSGQCTRAEINMVDRVVRPYVGVLNECEIHEVDPVAVNEATVSAVVAMFSELAMRTIPKGSPTAIHGFVQDIMQDFQESFLKAMAVNFDVKFELASSPAQAPPAGTTVQ